MYLHKVRKSPLQGFSVNLSVSQMFAVIFLFFVFFVIPVITFHKINTAHNPSVAGAYTSTTAKNSKEQILKITRIATIGSVLMLGVCILIVINNNYDKHKIFEL